MVVQEMLGALQLHAATHVPASNNVLPVHADYYVRSAPHMDGQPIEILLGTWADLLH